MRTGSRRAVSDSAGEDEWSRARRPLRGGREEVREAEPELCELGTWCWWRRALGPLLENYKKGSEIRVLTRFHRVVLGELDSLRAFKNAQTFVNFKSSLWMRPGWMRACFWTWLRYIRAGIWSCAAFTQNSDKLFLAARFPSSCSCFFLNWI